LSANFGDIPVRTNLLIAASVGLLSGFYYFVLPMFLLPASPLFGLLLIPSVLASNTYWAIIHEALHGKIHPTRQVNNALGRSLCVLFGSPFQLLRFGHLMHHRFNRSPIDRAEVFTAGGPSRMAVGTYYFKLLGGLYLLELLASLVALFPKPYYRAFVLWAFGEVAPDGRTMKVAAEGQLLERPGYGRMQFDGLLVVMLFGASFWLYGAHWWMLALTLLGRAFLVSFFDNAYHYGNPVDDPLAGYNLHLPRPLERFILNFNLHATHHRYPRAPWSVMPAAFKRDKEAYHLPYLPAAIRQLNGMIDERELAG